MSELLERVFYDGKMRGVYHYEKIYGLLTSWGAIRVSAEVKGADGYSVWLLNNGTNLRMSYQLIREDAGKPDTEEKHHIKIETIGHLEDILETEKILRAEQKNSLAAIAK